MQARTRFIHHRERAIVLMDFSQLQSEATALAAIDEARRFIAAQPRVRSLLTLVDVTDSTYSPEVVDALKALARHDEPWVIAGAVVGLNAFRRIALRIVVLLTGRKLAVFANQLQALEWLVNQRQPPTTVPDVMSAETGKSRP